jgi:hypothetical protein
VAAIDKLEMPVTFKQGEEFQNLAERVRRVGRVETK